MPGTDGYELPQEELRPTSPCVADIAKVPFPTRGVSYFCDSTDRPNEAVKGKTATFQTLELARQHAIDAKTHGAKGDTLTTEATVAAGSATATIAGLDHTYVGKVISIAAAGDGADLVTTITAVSGTSVTLADAATDGGTDAVTYIGTSDNAALTAANTAAGTSGTLLFPPGAYLITANLTLNAGTSQIMRGVTFVVLEGFTLTISGLADVAEAQRAGLKVGEGTLTSSSTGAATGTTPGTMSAADKAKLDTIQGGVVTLVAGTTALIPATITANSRIIVSMKTPGTTDDTTEYAALAADRVVGVAGGGGGFKVTALIAAGTINVADVSVLDWLVFN